MGDFAVGLMIERLRTTGKYDDKVLDLFKLLVYREEDEIDECRMLMLAQYEKLWDELDYYLVAECLDELGEEIGKVLSPMLDETKNSRDLSGVLGKISELVNASQDSLLIGKLTQCSEKLTTLNQTLLYTKQVMSINPYKVYLEYLISFRLEDGSYITDNKILVKKEVDKLIQTKKLLIKAGERTIGEFTNVKSQIKETPLIPPGVKRMIMDGMTAKVVALIVDRAIGVTNFLIVGYIDYWDWQFE
ncbi:MAG: hypothetical protein Q7S37_03825 [bacterium]|nr:hypothetical protein [bacterium]